MRPILIACVCVLATMAAADTVTLRWDLPTERTDGTPLPASEIAEIRIYCGSHRKTVDGHPTNGDVDLPAGKHICHVTAVDTGGRESGPSNTKVATIKTSRPPKPALDVIAYSTVFMPTGRKFRIQWDLPGGKPAKWRLRMVRPARLVVAKGISGSGDLDITLRRSGFYVFEYWHTQKNRWYGTWNWDNHIRLNGWSDKRHWWIHGFIEKPKARIE